MIMDWNALLPSDGPPAGDMAAIFELLERPGVLSFAGGLPDTARFRTAQIAAAGTEVLTRHGPESLQYSPSPGFRWFREFLSERLARRGIPAAPAELVVTAGGSQAFDLVCRAMLRPGDHVLVEAPTFLGALATLRLFPVTVHGVPVDDKGLSVDQLADALRRLRRQGARPRFLYTIPNFQNPTGCTLTEPRRRELVRLATEWGLPLLEDDAYGELGEGAPLPALKALHPAGVVFLGTFSKIFAPGLRLGWLAGPPELAQRVVGIRQSTDQCPSSFAQFLARACDAAGILDGQIEDIRAALRRRRTATLDALARHMPEEARWTRPDGGYYTWVTLPPPLDAGKLLPEAVERQRVAYVPGAAFYPEPADGRRQLRLSYSLVEAKQIPDGIARLGTAFRSALSAG
ncbi:MAG: PLP-dependent aminotransferase family protein [Thermaerobacter sp.]|nr:PLP-dependent aminotransferase family protein [Thermaerobacter sp.]